jgi:cystathionine beta-lyase/cystathionine gamma-synthase
MLSLYFEDAPRAESFLNRVRIPLHAPSLGGVETLVVRPSRSTHLGQSEEDRQRLGITDELVRISVGIEDPEELEADFIQALEGQ